MLPPYAYKVGHALSFMLLMARETRPIRKVWIETQNFAGDYQAIPEYYLGVDPDLENHVKTFVDDIHRFMEEVLGTIDKMMTGTIEINATNLKWLKENWIDISQVLTYHKDSMWRNHLVKPMEVN